MSSKHDHDPDFGSGVVAPRVAVGNVCQQNGTQLGNCELDLRRLVIRDAVNIDCHPCTPGCLRCSTFRALAPVVWMSFLEMYPSHSQKLSTIGALIIRIWFRGQYAIIIDIIRNPQNSIIGNYLDPYIRPSKNADGQTLDRPNCGPANKPTQTRRALGRQGTPGHY